MELRHLEVQVRVLYQHFPGGTEGKLENPLKENISHHGFEPSTSQYKSVAAPECPVPRAFINWSRLITVLKANP